MFMNDNTFVKFKINKLNVYRGRGEEKKDPELCYGEHSCCLD